MAENKDYPITKDFTCRCSPYDLIMCLSKLGENTENINGMGFGVGINPTDYPLDVALYSIEVIRKYLTPEFEKRMEKHGEDACVHIAQMEFSLTLGDILYELHSKFNVPIIDTKALVQYKPT